MSRCHGWQRATNVQDVRYVAVPWMAKSDECTVCRGAMRPTWMWEGRAMHRYTDVTY